jgi:hypothetical protein
VRLPNDGCQAACYCLQSPRPPTASNEELNGPHGRVVDFSINQAIKSLIVGASRRSHRLSV